MNLPRASALLAVAVACSGVACSSESPSAPDGGGDAGPDAAPVADAGPPDTGVDAGPPQLFGFVGSSDGTIRTFRVDAESGDWNPLASTPAGTNPSFLAFDPSRRRVVAVDEVGGMGLVRSFTFDPKTGALTAVNSKPAGGAGSTHLSLDPLGKWVFVANYTGGNASVLPLAADGTLGDATDTKASGANSHWAGTNPSGTHVFVPALGANVVAQYGFDANAGKLAANGTASLPMGAGPRHLAFHPSEKWAYVVNELAITVTTFDFDKVGGKLTAKATVSALPNAQPTAGVSGAEIFVHPSGKFVYASTRGFDSIAVFSVNATDGTVTRLDNARTDAPRPRSFALDPDGKWLFAGNQDAGEVVGFRIDGTTGMLMPISKVATVPGPAFVGLARMP
jgi:6-phosphogluconolactonase